MSFLSKLSELKKTKPKTVISPPQKANKQEEISLLPKNYVREEDPAVTRLKELRRQELLKNPELAKKKQKQVRKTPSSSKASTGKKDKNGDDNMLVSRFKRKVGSDKPAVPIQVKKKPQPIKKLSFEELMKQAENNQTIPVSKDTQSNGAGEKIKGRAKLNKPGFKTSRPKSLSPTTHINKTDHGKDKSTAKEKSEPVVKIGIPKFAQPNERLKKKLEMRQRVNKSRRYEDEEDDMDDFIEDDEEEYSSYRTTSKDPGYDRDEIWAMFNKGRKRSYNEYMDYEEEDDFDAMEANEMEILEEEEEAARMARLEDKREEAWLKKHEQEKKKKKLKLQKR